MIFPDHTHLLFLVRIRANIEKNSLCGRALLRVRLKVEKNTRFGRALFRIRAKIEKNTLLGRALVRIGGKLKYYTLFCRALVLNPIMVYSYGFLFNCTTVGQASDSMTALICTEKRLNTSLKDLSLALTNHGRHGLFLFLSSLPISVLRNLELEANKLYDRANKLYKAALLTRCYVHHFLSPYIDSEVNHKRHFIKIPFINKGIEFIDLHSIFKDNSVISSIPNYFNNSETPIICYKYNKPIRSTIFNFNKIVNDLDIDSNTPAS